MGSPAKLAAATVCLLSGEDFTFGCPGRQWHSGGAPPSIWDGTIFLEIWQVMAVVVSILPDLHCWAAHKFYLQTIFFLWQLGSNGAWNLVESQLVCEWHAGCISWVTRFICHYQPSEVTVVTCHLIRKWSGAGNATTHCFIFVKRSIPPPLMSIRMGVHLIGWIVSKWQK